MIIHLYTTYRQPTSPNKSTPHTQTHTSSLCKVLSQWGLQCMVQHGLSYRTSASLHIKSVRGAVKHPHLYAGQLPRRQHGSKEGLPGRCVPQVPADVPGPPAVLNVGPDVAAVVHSANLGSDKQTQHMSGASLTLVSHTTPYIVHHVTRLVKQQQCGGTQCVAACWPVQASTLH